MVTAVKVYINQRKCRRDCGVDRLEVTPSSASDAEHLGSTPTATPEATQTLLVSAIIKISKLCIAKQQFGSPQLPILAAKIFHSSRPCPPPCLISCRAGFYRILSGGLFFSLACFPLSFFLLHPSFYNLLLSLSFTRISIVIFLPSLSTLPRIFFPKLLFIGALSAWRHPVLCLLVVSKGVLG